MMPVYYKIHQLLFCKVFIDIVKSIQYDIEENTSISGMNQRADISENF
jgi:hypothetical protein